MKRAGWWVSLGVGLAWIWMLSGADQFAPISGRAESAAEAEFAADRFVFARIRYDSTGRIGWYGSGDWTTDYPDAELNLSYRLQELTALRVHPEGTTLRLTDSALFDLPFIYIVEPGELLFRPEEVSVLRRYLLNGGFLMVDDFWGEYEWQNFYQQLKRVFPEREPQELPLDHPIFQLVFRFDNKPQIPNVGVGTRSYWTGVTWERPDARTPHYRGVFDDHGRLMVIICHNTDLGDGWEREGENEFYFREFSEKKAYPLAINILLYAMTH
jgi:hypothetical protein